jgi:hypothetical protein
MTLKFENSSEAYLSVLSLVIGADQVGSLDERDFLFGKVKSLPMFGNPSASDFNKLLGRVTDAIYSELPTKDGVITPESINLLLSEAKKMLTPEQRKSLLQTATELSKSDGVSGQESALLAQLGRALR